MICCKIKNGKSNERSNLTMNEDKENYYFRVDEQRANRQNDNEMNTSEEDD